MIHLKWVLVYVLHTISCAEREEKGVSVCLSLRPFGFRLKVSRGKVCPRISHIEAWFNMGELGNKRANYFRHGMFL